VTDGGAEWLPLKEALDRFSDPEAKRRHQDSARAYAEARRLASGLPRWVDGSAAWHDAEPARHAIANRQHAIANRQHEARAMIAKAWNERWRSFLDRLRSGELLCRAREGSPLGPRRGVPADAWATLRVESWPAGRLIVPGTQHRFFSAQVAARAVPEASSVKPGEVLRTDPRAAVAGAGLDRRAFSRADVERWYQDRWLPGCLADKRAPSRDEELEAARQVFPGVPREFVRILRRQLAPAEWSAHGRPRKVTKRG
jgi:hypothetical protein